MKSSHTGSLTHGKVVHALNRRVRIISPVLLKDPERACVLEIMLQKRDGIEKVRTVPDIASIVIHFDPKKLPKAKLFTLLDALLGNLGKRKPNATLTQLAPAVGDVSLAEQEFNLTVDGMTCVSCALLIEMLLKRDPRITSANVNYASETASVIGRVNKETLCTLIDNMGYKAHSLDSLAQRQIMIVREKKRLIDARRRAVLSAVLSLPVMMIGMAAPASRYWHWAQHLLATPIVIWAGWPFFEKAIKLAKQRATNMDSLIALGVGSSYGYSVASLLAGKRGLYFEAIPADTQWEKDLITKIKRGDISQNSFGFVINKDEWDKTEKIRTLTEVTLFDVSPVTYPAYKDTEVHVRWRDGEAILPITSITDDKKKEIKELIEEGQDPTGLLYKYGLSSSIYSAGPPDPTVALLPGDSKEAQTTILLKPDEHFIDPVKWAEVQEKLRRNKNDNRRIKGKT